MANIILLGTKSFGRAVADAIDARYNLLGVYAPAGVDALGRWAREGGVWLGENPDPAFIPRHTDLVVAAHWTRYVGPGLVSSARHGAIIGHPSLLPRHRGIASVEWTIRCGDPIAGFSWFRPVEEMDAGPVVHQKWCHVDPTWNASALWREALFPLGVGSVVQAISKALAGIETPQDEVFATEAPRLARV